MPGSVHASMAFFRFQCKPKARAIIDSAADRAQSALGLASGRAGPYPGSTFW